MTSTCQSCGTAGTGGSGRCPVCGGVCRYDQPWSPSPQDASAATPIITSRVPGLEGTLLKVEGANPSGSFKDRVMRVLVAEAVGNGARGAVVASSGNAAVAAAAACAQYGLPLLVLVPEAASLGAIRQAELRGAVVVRGGEGPAAVHGLAAQLSAEHGLPNLASTFGAAGCEWACRGIGAELAAQVNTSIRHLAASISVGPVLVGAATGLTEAGRQLPALVGAQAVGCGPIAQAFQAGENEVAPWTGPVQTAALAIADRLTGYAAEASFALHFIRATDGRVDAADDVQMLAMRRDLAMYDGLDVELASAAAPAVLRTAGLGGPETVCVLTGSGVKETLSTFEAPPDANSLDDFAAITGLGAYLVEEVEQWLKN